ncbi:hypothetical protein Tco_1226463 [Tanacetum coccineum]
MDFSDDEDDEENNEEEEDDYEMLYRDVNVNLQQEDADKTNDDQGGAQDLDIQYEDAHLLNLENVYPAEYTLASVMDTTAQKTSFTVITTTPLPLPLVIPPTPQATPIPAPTIHAPTILESTTSVPVLLDFAFVFQFNQRVSSLEQEVSQIKQADNSAQLIESSKSQIPTLVDKHLSTRLGYAVQTAFQSYKVEFEKEAQAEQERFIEIIDKSVKEMIKDEVKSQLTNILPKKIADFATLLIESKVADSHERVVLAKSSSQSKSTYEAAASLSEFELKKILIDKIKDSESYRAAPEHRELYDCLAKSYKLDKDLIESYGESYSLKRDRDKKDKDKDPSAGPNRGEKRRKTDKDAQSSKEPKSKGSKSSHKSTGKSAHTEEPRHDSGMPHDQEFDTGNNDDQPAVEATKDDWFKKPDKPPTLDREWNKRQLIDFRPPQTWISRIAKEKEPPRTFVELEYHLEEVYKVVNDRLDWNNPKDQAYPFDLSMPLLFIQDERGRQVILVNYFINNDLEYLKGGSSSRKYTTSTMKTKAAMYDNILGIEDMVPTLWSPTKMAYDKHAVWGVSHWGPKRKRYYGYACHFESNHDVFSTKRIIGVTHVEVEKWYDYGYIKEIEVRREDNQLYTFKEGDFPRLNLRDIEDLLLLLVQKKISNLEKGVLYDLNVALRMFTRRIVILKRVEDLKLRVKSVTTGKFSEL